ncbi:hypothetical protein B0T22DRAFT_299665 [Podospora appendiculata]|uniref:Uncharacterized protein n=1 Tax=Podospora appendiculata TaxID=314037 RepID=A0AAE1C7K1_9PEZI|nr:hypothetical protein B0T22DRAFT_299665 [Podospora appendiculata]
MMEWSRGFPLLRRQFNESNDPRIGSGRDGQGGGSLSHATSSGTNSASLGSLGSTFVPVLLFSVVCLFIFVFFRRKCPRVYAPRCNPVLRAPEQPSPQLPTGWVNWIKPFFAINDTYVLNNCSLDGYFFLRYLKVLSIICLVGCCLTWPVLLPVNGTGGSGMTQLDLLTIGNIKLPSSFYAHVLVAWCFFGFVIFIINRECIYYVNLRQAYLMSPNYSKRLSSRTVLYTCIPKPYVDEAKLRKLFGKTVKNIWIPRNTNILRGLYEDREDAAQRLEKAEIKLITMANAARARLLQQHPANASPKPFSLKTPSFSVHGSTHDDTEKAKTDSAVRFAERQVSMLDSPTMEKPEDLEYTHPYGYDSSLPDVRGSVASQWIPAEARPHHRPIANFGRRIDTIRWTRARLKALNRDIWKLRRAHRGGDGVPLNAAFIEFDSQASAQEAYQILAHHQPLHMSPRFIGIRPEEVVWSSLRIKWWEHIMRRFFMMAAISTAIIFWSFPSAIVGMISNIKFLTEKLTFLSFIMLIPEPIISVITGLLPAVALSMLMAAVPIMLRGCARVAGVPSHALVELFVQNAYFAFQVVQVFLVTTLTSAASAALTGILTDPLSAKDVLSENLPKASNFYLSYILVQCLAAGALKLANIGDLFRHALIAKMSNDPRRRFQRWNKLTRIHWGSVYPRFTNMGVIAISYSCIAPLILVFAGLGMLFVGMVYRYSLLYVHDSDLDTKGLFYPRALIQLMIGLYVAEICLVGLFALKAAIGPLLLMVMFLIFTALVHISLNEAVAPLLNNLPRTLALENEMGQSADNVPAEQGTNGPWPTEQAGGLAANYYDEDEHFGDEPEPPPLNEMDNDIQMRGIEGSSSIKYTMLEWAKSLLKVKLHAEVTDDSSFTRFLAQLKAWLTPDPQVEPNFLMHFFHPEIYQDFRALQRVVNPGPDTELPDDYVRRSYWPPEMWRPAPKLWIPKDDARVSRQEVAHSKDAIAISDQACWLDEKGRVVCVVEESPLIEPRVLY